jgi:hypothetical protein
MWWQPAHFLPLQNLAFFLCLLDEPYIAPEDSTKISPWEDHLKRFTTASQFALLFVSLFTSGWPQQQLRCSSGFGNGWVRIQLHFRYLSLFTKADKKPDEPLFSGIRCNRVCNTIDLPNNHPMGHFTMQEARYSVALCALRGRDWPPFLVLTLFDGQENPRLMNLINEESWKSSKIISNKCYPGVAVFQLVLNNILYSWSRAWQATLDSLDTVLQTMVSCHQFLLCMSYSS